MKIFKIIGVIVGMLIFILLAIGSTSTESDEVEKPNTSTTQKNEESKNNDTDDSKKVKVTIVDFSSMTQTEIQKWADSKKIICEFSEDYSDSIAKGSLVSQSSNAGESINEGDIIKIVFSLGKKPSIEYMNALKKAETYATTMHMSKKGLYNQLTSEYGEQFPADAAQYAVDNVKANWNANALEKAKTYQSDMSMSKNAIYDQLISEYGEQFTKEEAQYAIDHLDD